MTAEPAGPRRALAGETRDATQVLIAGGGPVGLAAAIELGQRGIDCIVIEPRSVVSRARPRCKTLNVRTIEHLGRWGLIDRVRAAAPLKPVWSSDLVFCTTLSGYELSRFTGVFGLELQGDRFPEVGQQAPQFVLEEVLREAVAELRSCDLVLGERVAGLAQNDHGVRVTVVDGAGASRTIAAEHVIGADGARSAVREAIGIGNVGETALRPNFGLTFRAPELWRHVAHGRAVQYWIVNPAAAGIVGPQDGHETWWAGFVGVDRERGERDADALLAAAIGVPTPFEVLSTDPWTARMELADRFGVGRVHLAGDAAHLNPPFGGHGLNTGIGDAVDLGWKLSATLHGWAGEQLLDSYEAERRPVANEVIVEAQENMATLPTELGDPEIAAPGPAGEDARARADARIQETKAQEFLSIDFVLGLGYGSSPIVVADGGGARAETAARPGYRLPHAWLRSGASIYDELGDDMTLLHLGERSAEESASFERAARDRGVPLRVCDLRAEGLSRRYGAELVLVRPDQHVAWRGAAGPPSPPAEIVVDTARGATPARQPA